MSKPNPPDKAALKPVLLLVHPQKELRQQYRDFLEDKGYRVEVADTGAEALDCIYRILPDFVVSEIILPDINGYQLCRLVKNDPATRRIPFLLISGYDEKIDRFWGHKAGADAFVSQSQIGSRKIQEDLLQQLGMLSKIYVRDTLSPGSTPESSPAREAEGGRYNLRTRLYQLLDKSLIENTLMTEFRKLYDLIHDKTLLNYMLFTLMEDLLDYDLAGIFYNDQGRESRLVTFHVPEGMKINPTGLEEIRDALFDSLNLPVPAAERSHDLIGEASEEEIVSEYATVFRHPFVRDGKVVGAIVFYAVSETRYEGIFPTSEILNELQILMKLRHLYSQAENHAMTDDLTQLLNYQMFMKTLEREFQKSKRYGLPLSLALVEIDDFKALNEKWGHLLGDEILKSLAAQTVANFRAIDVVARYDRKTLAVLMPGTNLEGAQVPCNRLLKTVQSTPVSWKGATLETRLNIGITEYNESVGELEQLLRNAESALRLSVENGRNRIELCAGSNYNNED